MALLCMCWEQGLGGTTLLWCTSLCLAPRAADPFQDGMSQEKFLLSPEEISRK